MLFSKLRTFCLSFNYKKLYSNHLKKLKQIKIYLNHDPCNDLSQVINPDFASENINDLLSIYGLNPKSFSNYSNKLWNHSLFIFFWMGIFKYATNFFLNPITNYKLCIYLGDATLLFESLRTFTISVTLLSLSYAICTNYLFNYDSNISWFDIFKCLDGTLTPHSIRITNKKILKKLLLLTKITFKLTKFSILMFSIITMCICIFLLYKKINFSNNFEMIVYMIWMILISFWVYFMTTTMFISAACFQIICYYCLITTKHYNQLLDHSKTDQSFGWRRLDIKLKIMNLIKKQNKFSHQIMKYNKFWCKYFLIMMIHLIPTHILIVQQLLLGDINFLLKVILLIGSTFATITIVLSSLLSSFLVEEIRNFSKKLIRIQFNRYLNLDIKIKLKVSLLCFFFNQI